MRRRFFGNVAIEPDRKLPDIRRSVRRLRILNAPRDRNGRYRRFGYRDPNSFRRAFGRVEPGARVRGKRRTNGRLGFLGRGERLGLTDGLTPRPYQ